MLYDRLIEDVLANEAADCSLFILGFLFVQKKKENEAAHS